jgi:hypothetical protein
VEEKTLRTFLMKQPRPARIVVRTEDDDVQEVTPPSGKGGVTWANIASTILALRPSQVECYDVDGHVLRATRGDGDDEKPKPGEPTLLATLHSDPETARMTHFANLIFRATEFSTTLAFTKMVELFQIQADRAIALETRLERAEASYRRAMQERVDDAFDAAEEKAQAASEAATDPVSELVRGFVGGATAGKAAPPNGSKV